MSDKEELKQEIRDGRLVVYMTPSDLETLNEISSSMGLSRSALVASVMERHIISGFSPLGGAKVCWQIQKRLEERGHPFKGMYFGIRPYPPLPEEQLAPAESKQLLETISKEIEC